MGAPWKSWMVISFLILAVLLPVDWLLLSESSPLSGNPDVHHLTAAWVYLNVVPLAAGAFFSVHDPPIPVVLIAQFLFWFFIVSLVRKLCQYHRTTRL
jgi:hypothetical protein